MALPPDYHMHTPLCRHATGSPMDYAAQAAKLGLSEIGFSDHSPMSADDFDDWRMRNDQLDQYVEDVRAAQRAFPELRIRLALEVDFLPGQEDWIRDLASRHDWDYLIGSVHYVSTGWAIDNPNQMSRWRERGAFEVWSEYFDLISQAASTGLFDIMGHADLPKKFDIRPREDCTPLFTKFLDAVTAADIAIELNTAGLRKDCGEIYPSETILRLARERNVPITFGSDAHSAGEVGMGLGLAVDLARKVGYTESCQFEYRQRSPRRLG